jgi:GTP cyclohydrolase III
MSTYAYFDGDDIGAKLELLLLDDKEEDARSYSQSINSAVARLREFLSLRHVETILVGGDDLIAFWPSGHISMREIENARKIFLGVCSCTISVGIGSSLSEAAFNLRRAKLQGKNQVVSAIGSQR